MTVFMCCHHGKAIARVHLIHLMNADWAPGGRQPSSTIICLPLLSLSLAKTYLIAMLSTSDTYEYARCVMINLGSGIRQRA